MAIKISLIVTSYKDRNREDGNSKTDRKALVLVARLFFVLINNALHMHRFSSMNKEVAMNNELERSWRKGIVIYFNELL